MQACAAVLHGPVRCLDRACAYPPQSGQVLQSLPRAAASLYPFGVCPCIRVPSDACHRQRPTETQDKSRRSLAQRQPEYPAPSPRSFFSRLTPWLAPCLLLECDEMQLTNAKASVASKLAVAGSRTNSRTRSFQRKYAEACEQVFIPHHSSGPCFEYLWGELCVDSDATR